MTNETTLSKLYVKQLAADRPPYEVDDSAYQRFDQRNNLTVGRPKWDATVQKFTRQTVPTRVGHIKSGLPGYHLEDYSLFLAGGVTVFGSSCTGAGGFGATTFGNGSKTMTKSAESMITRTTAATPASTLATGE